MRTHPAVTHKGVNSEFGTSFLDFLGCIAVCSMFDQVLEGRIEAMDQAGESIPKGSRVSAVMENPEYADGVVVLVVVSNSRPGSLHATSSPKPDFSRRDG